jgi:cysteine desulfurase
LSFPGLKSEVIVHALEQEKVFVSSKSACSSKKETPSRVLTAMGLDDRTAIGSIRISMGYDTVESDIRQCAQALIRVIPELQRVMKGR